MSGGGSQEYWEKDHGAGQTERRYYQGATEWRYDRGNGWTEWKSSDGSRGWEIDHGSYIERRVDGGETLYGKKHGDSIEWSDGTWTKKR